jgi:hypothetical protein
VDNAFLAVPKRRRVWLLTATVVVVLAAAGLVLARQATTSGSAESATAGPMPGSSATAAPSAALMPSAMVSAPPVLLRLVRGTRTVAGVSVGYPHTRAGAVSAGIEYVTQVTSNLDLQRAVAIGGAITDGSRGSADVFANGPMSTRQALGVATTGPVPAGASVVTSPAAYQVRDAGQDSILVLVLAYLTLRSESVGLTSRTAVFPIQLVWKDGDWKDTQRAADAPDYTGLGAPPGTPAAVAAGWQEFLK